MDNVIAFPVWRRQQIPYGQGVSALVSAVAQYHQPREGKLVEFRRRPHFLDAVIARERAQKDQPSRVTRRAWMRYAILRLAAEQPRQFAVLNALLFDTYSVGEVASATGQTPASVYGYRRRGLANLLKNYRLAEDEIG